MAYETHFVKFGSQSRSKIFTPVHYHPKWSNPNFYKRAVGHFGTSLAGFGLAAFTYLCFTTEWKVVCQKIPIYKSKFGAD